ncbi:MAG: hypothetical protein ACERKZ_05505 [Lachnotalea sp.]
MFCVIQEIETKKPNKNGHSKELHSCFMSMSFNGEDMSHYWYRFSDERFERPVKKAYKVSIHQSYREDGRVKKKQYSLCTVKYYDIAEEWFNVYDYCNRKINAAACELGVEEELIYDLVEEKLNPLIESIQNEFRQTEEYITHEEHENVTTVYALNKTKFNSKYDLDGTSSKYDECYDVFGNLMNKDKLDKIKADYEVRKEYEEKSRGYQEDFYSNYSKNFSGSGSYFNNNQSNHDLEDKEMLKQFYRVLSKKFHPDSNPGKDTSEEMKLLNQLKSDWGL